MRNDRVLIPVLHGFTWHTILNAFHLVYTRIFIDNYPTTLFYHKKCQRLGSMGIK